MFDFQILSSTTRYQGNKLRFDTLKLKTPENKVVEWDRVVISDIVYAVPITKENEVILVQEWRTGPEKVLTQLVGARYDENHAEISEIKRELEEEIGLQGGTFTKLIGNLSNGPHLSGFKSYYLVEDFTLGKIKRDENEILNIVKIPLDKVLKSLEQDYLTTTGTLLGIKYTLEKKSRF
ncbi:MAG: NUDIX hydrolase [bacterium]